MNIEAMLAGRYDSHFPIHQVLLLVVARVSVERSCSLAKPIALRTELAAVASLEMIPE